MNHLVDNVPLWLALVTFLGGIAVPLVVSFARRSAARIRGDADKGNDWAADALDAIADALSQGDTAKAARLLAGLKGQASTVKKP